MIDEIQKAIGRLRRSQGRNADTMELCDGYEKLWSEYKKLASSEKLEIVTRAECATCEDRRRKTRERVAAFRKRRAEVKQS